VGVSTLQARPRTLSDRERCARAWERARIVHMGGRWAALFRLVLAARLAKRERGEGGKPYAPLTSGEMDCAQI
jgi:hypothetical protein